MVWQSSTAGHTGLAQIVSYDGFLNTDPESFKSLRQQRVFDLGRLLVHARLIV
jgi:hypothetical protein